MLLGLQDYVLLDGMERDRRVPVRKRDAEVSEESEERGRGSCRKIALAREGEEEERKRDAILMSLPADLRAYRTKIR